MTEKTEKRGRGRPKKADAKTGAQRQAEFISGLKRDAYALQHIAEVIDAAPDDAMFSVNDIFRMISDGRVKCISVTDKKGAA